MLLSDSPTQESSSGSPHRRRVVIVVADVRSPHPRLGEPLRHLEVRLPSHGSVDDTDIAVVLSHAMTSTISIPLGSIQPTVQKGWVTLEGTVAWDYQRLVAARIARDARGVMGVTDRVRLQDTAQGRHIEQDIRAAIRRRADLDAQAIHVRCGMDGPPSPAR